MKKENLLLAFILFVLGFIGVLSLLTMELQLPDEVMTLLLAQFSEREVKLLTLVNPTILLIIAVVVGTLLHKKVNLGAPVIEGLIAGSGFKAERFLIQAKIGFVGGLFAGIGVLLTALAFASVLPAELKELGVKMHTPMAVRFLYGGITEEILMRFGLMTLLVWLLSMVTRSLQEYVYWVAILVSAVLFAIGHFPIAFQLMEQPSVSLLAYILIGNSIGGIVFGWLYWRHGIEAAFIAHIVLHIVVVVSNLIQAF